MLLDTEEAQEKATRTFPLKNADATDVAKQLKDLNQDPDSSSRYPYFMFSGGSPTSKSQKTFSVVADRRRNTIIVQAPPATMDGIAKMVAALDEPVTDESLSPKIYQLKYVSAVDMEDVLNELFLKKKDQQRPYWFYDDAPQETADRDVGRLYGKVRITSEPHSNALILTSNSKENLEAVEAILQQLDVPSAGGESTLRVELQFAKAFHGRQQPQRPVRQERFAALAAGKPTQPIRRPQPATAASAGQLLPERLRSGTGNQRRRLFSVVGRAAG